MADSAIPIYSDQPVRSIAEDRLGFADYAATFQRLISAPRTPTPLTVAISGEWGLLASRALLDALHRDPPLAPVLGRLVHYRPAGGAEGAEDLGSERDGDAGAALATGP